MRVKGGAATRRSKKRILKEANGFYGKRSTCWKTARQIVRRSKQQAFVGRKLRKRQNRSLWITRLSAATRMRGLNYSRFVFGLGKAGVELDRRMLAEMAVNDPAAFDAVFQAAKGAL